MWTLGSGWQWLMPPTPPGGGISDRAMGDIWALSGDGHLAAGHPVEAASAYQKAADATKMPGEHAVYLAKTARALMAAGKNAESRAIWEKLVADPNATVVRNEAEIRLGELSAQAAGKS